MYGGTAARQQGANSSMTPTQEQLDQWSVKLDEHAAELAAAGDHSLSQFAWINRPAATACVYLTELLGEDNPKVRPLVEAFGHKHKFCWNLEKLLDAATDAAIHLRKELDNG